MASSLSLEPEINDNTSPLLQQLPTVAADNNGNNGQNKNEYVIALQAQWSPQYRDEQSDANSTYNSKTVSQQWNEKHVRQDDHREHMLTDDCYDDSIAGVSATDLFLAQDDTVNTMDFMMIDQDTAEEGAQLHIHQASGIYNEIQELLYGMNKRKINQDAALIIARKYPQDPVMVAVQALLLQEQHSPNKFKYLWLQAKQLGLESRAKEDDHGLAQALAGCMMEHTVNGVHFFAESWYEQGANTERNNNATAQYFLALTYEESRDYETAHQWYERAALQGHAAAQTRLGRLFRKGLIVVGDDVNAPAVREASAKHWFAQAALQGDVQGQVNLAFLYYKEHDQTSARYWYNKALETGFSPQEPQSKTADESDKEMEKYLYDKAQSNLSQLFVQDDTIASNDKNQALVKQKSKSKAKTSVSELFAKMRSGGLQLVSESGSGTACPPSLRAALNSQKGLTGTATLTSLMSLQSLSLGSIHTLSVASTDSFRQGTFIFRFASDEISFTRMNFEGNHRESSSTRKTQKDTKNSLDASGSFIEDTLPIGDSFPDDEELAGQSREGLAEEDTMQTDDSASNLKEALSPHREGLLLQEQNNSGASSEMEIDNSGATSKPPNGDLVANTSSFVSRATPNSPPLPDDVIKPFHAVLGDRSARGPRVTVGTKELRNAKDWFREHRLSYQREGRQSELFKDAMSRYYAKMSELFDDFPGDEVSREKTILIHCSKHVQESGRVQSQHCFRHVNDKEHQYGTALFPDAVLFYFNNRDPPKLDDLVAKYRRKLQGKANLKGARREYFERYLEFCEMTINMAAEGSPAAQLAAEKNNFIPTLKALWEDIEKEIKNGDQIG